MVRTRSLHLASRLRCWLTAAIRWPSRGEPADLAEVSCRVDGTADDVTATPPNRSRLPLTPEEQQQRQRLLAELHQLRCFRRVTSRRWLVGHRANQPRELAPFPLASTSLRTFPRWLSAAGSHPTHLPAGPKTDA